MKRLAFIVTLILASLFAFQTGSVEATPMTFTGSSGNLSASVEFINNGAGTLTVILTNTSTADVLVPADVLTAVFFTLEGNPTLTPVSATICSTCTVFFGGTDPNGVVGGEWAYANNLSSAPGGANEGTSSVGLGLFGPGNLFPGSDLQNPLSPDGLQYGITSAGDDPTTGNTPVTGTNALIQNQVIFTLAGLPTNFDPSTSISDVSFQYGTSLSEPNIPGDPIPEPVTLILLGSGLAGLGLWKRRMA